MAKKKILYVWVKPYPWDVRVDKMCNSLAKKYDVTILARWAHGQSETETLKNITIHRVGYKQAGYKSLPVPGNLLWKKSIRKIVDTLKPDAIIVREMILAEMTGKIGKQRDIPVIMDMAEHYPGAMRDWKKYNSNMISKFMVHTLRIPDRIEKSSMKYMDGIITVCNEQNNRLFSEYNFELNKQVVVHNTPHLDWLEDSKENAKKAIVFGHHGHMTNEKSIESFVQGFIKAAINLKHIRLILAGAGECFDEIKRIVSASQCADRIDMLGSYDHKELKLILERINVGVVPYQISDFNNYTIHNKIFDYFVAGRPVLTSLMPPTKRIIDETKAGWAVDCTDVNEIAEKITDIVNSDISSQSNCARSASQTKYNWGVDEKSLLEFIDKYM